MLVDIPLFPGLFPDVKDLIFEGHKMGLAVDVSPVDANEYETWVRTQDKERRLLRSWDVPLPQARFRRSPPSLPIMIST